MDGLEQLGRWSVPSDWRWLRAKDFASVVGGGTPKDAKDPSNYDPDGTPWITPADLSGYSGATIRNGARSLSAEGLRKSSARRLPAGTVLISSRAPVGYCVVADGEVTTNQGFRSLVLNDEVNPFFIRYYVLASKTYLEDNASGTTFKELPGKVLGDLLFPIPPLDTQRRIVARIDELFSELEDGEAALARARADLETYRKSLLKAAVTGELTADWRAANPPAETGEQLLQRILAHRKARWEADPKNKGKSYKEPVSINDRELAELPLGWCWASLDQLVSEQERSFQSGPFGSSLLHSEFQATGKLVIGIDNVQAGWFSPGSQHRISDEKYRELVRYKARPEDVLITVMATIGRSCVVPHDIEDAIITKHIYRMTIDRYAALPSFVECCFRGCPLTLRDIHGNVQGQTRPGLNKGILQRVAIPVPPMREQDVILELLRSEGLSGLSSDQVKAASLTSEQLRQSILAAAFRGELVQ